MTLQTIAVRYEDVDGRHIDVHDAADSWYYEQGMLIVAAHKCDCCDAQTETTHYNVDSVIKMDMKPSDHDL